MIISLKKRKLGQINCDDDTFHRWIYYENVSYNSYQPGKVYWVHGIEIAAAFPVAYSDMVLYSLYFCIDMNQTWCPRMVYGTNIDNIFIHC